MKPLIVLATTTVCSLSLTITSPVVFNAHLVDLQRALVNTTLVYTNTTVDSFASNCKLKLTTHDLVAIEMKDINSIKDCLVELPSDKSLTVDSVMLNTGYHDGILMALPWHVYHTGFFLNNQFSSTLDVPKALSNLHNLNSEIDGLALDSSDDGMMTLFSELSHSNYTDFERVFAGLLQIRKYINETDEPFSKFKLNKTMMAYDKLVNPETTGLNYSITSFCSDSHNHSISVIDGLYIGVYKYSRNINQSMDALNALTSVEYQRSLSADLQLGQHWTTPIYKSLWDDSAACESNTAKCEFLANVESVVKPYEFFRTNYDKASAVIAKEMRDFIRGNASDVQIIVDKLLSELLNLDNQNTLTSSVSLSMPTTAPTPVKNPTIQNPTPSPSPYPISNGSFILNLVTIVVSITVLLFLVILVLYQKFKPETRDVGLKIGLLGVLRQEGTEKERLIKKQ